LPALDALAAELRRVIADVQAEKRLPSVAAAVVRDGEIVWADAVGLADTESGEEATPDHQYRIGSITKTFTAVAVMQLRAEGKLDLDDRLDSHLDVPAHVGHLTPRRMLAHASGLQREIPGDVWESLEFPKTTGELLATLGEAEQVLGPGERWHYSNLAYILLGEVVAKLSGMPYEDYAEQRILQPLGLSRTGFAPQAPTAVAYRVDPYSDVVAREPMMVDRVGGIAAAGQLWSTVEDLCRWARFLADPDEAVLADDAVETMTTVQAMADPYRWTLGWGTGLMLARDGEHVYCGHDGGMPGYVANVLASREDKIGAAVLMNAGNFGPTELSLRLLAKLREQLPPERPAWRPAEGAPPELAGVVGRWWTEGVEFVLRWHDGRLEARAAEAADWIPWARFEPIGDDRFRTVFGRERGELLRVVRAEDGTPTKLYWATYPMTRDPQGFGDDAPA
jgi:CubicO group peptidase (beta-lactamase class C family)